MSEDLIKRSDAAEVVYKALKIPPLKGVLTDTMSLAIALVRDIPSADRPQGEWVESPYENADGMTMYRCSECGCLCEGGYNYCFMCGARMKGEDE